MSKIHYRFVIVAPKLTLRKRVSEQAIWNGQIIVLPLCHFVTFQTRAHDDRNRRNATAFQRRNYACLFENRTRIASLTQRARP